MKHAQEDFGVNGLFVSWVFQEIKAAAKGNTPNGLETARIYLSGLRETVAGTKDQKVALQILEEATQLSEVFKTECPRLLSYCKRLIQTCRAWGVTHLSSVGR